MDYKETTGLKGPFRIIEDLHNHDRMVVDSNDTIAASVCHDTHGEHTLVIAESVRNGLCIVEFRHNVCDEADFNQMHMQHMMKSHEQQIGRALTHDEECRVFGIHCELYETLQEFENGPKEEKPKLSLVK